MSKKNYALVTGASRGIGKAITSALLEKGARLIGTAHQSSLPEVFLSNPNFEGLRVDLARQKDLESKLRPIFKRDEAPNVLVNNAGIFSGIDITGDDEAWLANWDNLLQINLRAPALLSKWALERWKQQGYGQLINISSRAGFRGDTQQYAAYAASKGGLIAFTKSVARDFGKHGVSAYSVAPGFVDTDMADHSVETYGEEYLTQGMVFDEITSPKEVAELVTFLASGKVTHMTGTTFHINGGSYML